MKKVKFILTILTIGLILLSCSKPTEPEKLEKQLSIPLINPVGGIYTESQEATIISQTEGATLRYTLDGSDPSEFSTEYTTTLLVDSTMTIKARGYKQDWKESDVAIAIYKINIELQPIEWCLVTVGDYTYGENNDILNINYDYEIMKYEVTNAQYLTYLQEAYAAGIIWLSGSEVKGYFLGDEYMLAGNYCFYRLGTDLSDRNIGRISYSNGQFILNFPSQFTEEDYLNHPVVYVSWFGAWHFAQYYGWRLPTEYEWEKAARGLTGYTYPWGNTIDYRRANYRGSGDPYEKGTTSVGFYNGDTQIVNGVYFSTTDSPSPYGVYDMAGNVWNWTDSWFGEYWPNSRVVRGGSWFSYSNFLEYLLTWNRHQAGPNGVDGGSGFRCVRTIN